eukprot:1155125-Pelagomonas_calceolata.AAC.6
MITGPSATLHKAACVIICRRARRHNCRAKCIIAGLSASLQGREHHHREECTIAGLSAPFQG